MKKKQPKKKKLIQHDSALLSIWENVLASLVVFLFVPVVKFIKIEYNCF